MINGVKLCRGLNVVNVLILFNFLLLVYLEVPPLYWQKSKHYDVKRTEYIIER
jgi:hypothetical protein